MNELFENHGDKVYRFAISLSRDVHTAEDLTQETFLRAFRTKSPLRDQSRQKAWLFQILVNLWRDRHRKVGNVGLSLEGVDPPGRGFAPDQIAIRDEQQRIIFEAMARLPDQQRNVLHLRTVEQFSISEIAELLGSTTGAVKTNLSIARKRMRETMTDNQHIERTFK